MITGHIIRQHLNLCNSHVVADTIDYLEAKFIFKTDDWDGLAKWVHFSNDSAVYDIRLTEDCIRKEDHLNLSAGMWKVYLHGNEFRDGKVIQRITTDEAVLYVLPTGTLDGEPFPEMPASVTEQILARLEDIEQNGGGGGGIAQETDPTVPAWAKQPEKPTYTKKEVGLNNVDNVRQYSTENPPPYPVLVIPYGDTTHSFEDLLQKAEQGVLIGVFREATYTAWLHAYSAYNMTFRAYEGLTARIITYLPDGTWKSERKVYGSAVKEFWYGDAVSYSDIDSAADEYCIFLYLPFRVDGIGNPTAVFAGRESKTKTATFIADIANGKRIICRLTDTVWSYEVEDFSGMVGAVSSVNGAVPDENGNVTVRELPEYAEADEGKVLSVVDGEPKWAENSGGGGSGADGFSPSASVEQTDDGAIVTITDKDGTTTATITNGKDGQPGEKGEPGESPTVAVSAIDGGHRITITDKDGVKTVDVMDGTDGDPGEPGSPGNPGRGIVSVARTSSTGAAGTTDTYTITYTDNTTSTFEVYNGKDGDPYTLTDADKQDIAAAAAQLVDVPDVDDTLKVSGAAADAAKVGAELSNLSTAIADYETLTLGVHTDGLVYIFKGGVPIGTGVEVGSDGDVVGYVDSANNIVVKGNLADGTYTVKYEMDDGSTIDIGNLVLDTNVYYSVTNNLTNCTTSNSATQAISGQSYTATITANSGYELSSVVVTMGGTDISASAVSGGTISIASVAGNIVITAVAEESKPTYNNLLPQAGDVSGNEFVGANGEDGYKSGYRISASGGGESAMTGVYCTGFMKVSAGDDIYIKGITLHGTATNNNIVLYDASKNRIWGGAISTENAFVELTDDVYRLMVNQMSVSTSITFFRFCAGSITDETIVTVNEPIV
ncbi:MAG: collagen-like protein [Clostridia bacterium]|nr:collagen-like protein [Clostridia bacterium]